MPVSQDGAVARPEPLPEPPAKDVERFDTRSIHRWHMRRYFPAGKKADLKASIKDHGRCLVPVILALIGGELVAADGDCRLACYLELAAEGHAGFDAIPGVIDHGLDTREKLLGFLQTSQERSDRSVVDLGSFWKAYADERGLNQKELALALAQSEATVSRVLAVFDYPPDLVEALGNQLLTLHHFSAVTPLKTPEERIALLRRAVRERISAREVRKLAAPPKPKAATKVIRVSAEGLTLSFAAAMSVGDFKTALDGVYAQVQERLKEMPKASLLMKQVMGQ